MVIEGFIYDNNSAAMLANAIHVSTVSGPNAFIKIFVRKLIIDFTSVKKSRILNLLDAVDPKVCIDDWFLSVTKLAECFQSLSRLQNKQASCQGTSNAGLQAT